MSSDVTVTTRKPGVVFFTADEEVHVVTAGESSVSAVPGDESKLVVGAGPPHTLHIGAQ